jgi:hypothetical protein
MTKRNTIITDEQALAHLRAMRAAGHYIDWDNENNVPDIKGADGVVLDGYITWDDMQALLTLRMS